MKNTFLRTCFICSLLLIFIISCEKENEDNTPLINEVTAINHDTDGTDIPLGGTISINFEAQIQSDARLDYYHIEIHDHPVSGMVEDEYKIIDDSFKDDPVFKGLRNAHVHQHISVPDTANLGSYHVVIIVVDEAGYSTDTESLETHINIIE